MLKITPLTRTAELPEPPAYPVYWLAVRRYTHEGKTKVDRMVLKRRTWFDVRCEALRRGAEPAELEIIQGNRDYVEHDGVRYMLVTPDDELKMTKNGTAPKPTAKKKKL